MGVERRVRVQTVRDILNLSLTDNVADGLSELVVIGRDLDRAAFERGFARVAELSAARKTPGLDIDEPDLKTTSTQPTRQEQPYG